jgi:hypothetical protein
MPIPFMHDDGFIRRCVGWELCWSFLPRKCFYTKRSLWFKRAYMGTSILTGPGDPIFDYRWIDQKEYIFLKIRGVI